MSRVADAFLAAKREGRAALVTYLCAGDPSLAITPDLLVAAAEAGADVLEVGMPFSDPTADGPTIQKASERALAGGATLRGVLDAIAATRARVATPIVLFGYYNPILRYGEAALARDARHAGVDALLVVDLPPESASPLLEPLRIEGLDFVPLVAPTSPAARVAAAASIASGFVYYVSMTGVTGGASADLEAAARRAGALAEETGCPFAVGFGVSTPADVACVARHADGVVVGSALVRAVEAAPDDPARVAAVRALVTALRAATSR